MSLVSILLVLYLAFLYIVFGIGFSRAVDNDNVDWRIVVSWPICAVLVAIKGNK